jgi:hypothetical protein
MAPARRRRSPPRAADDPAPKDNSQSGDNTDMLRAAGGAAAGGQEQENVSPRAAGRQQQQQQQGAPPPPPPPPVFLPPSATHHQDPPPPHPSPARQLYGRPLVACALGLSDHFLCADSADVTLIVPYSSGGGGSARSSDDGGGGGGMPSRAPQFVALPAHRVLLAAASPRFASLLREQGLMGRAPTGDAAAAAAAAAANAAVQAAQAQAAAATAAAAAAAPPSANDPPPPRPTHHAWGPERPPLYVPDLYPDIAVKVLAYIYGRARCVGELVASAEGGGLTLAGALAGEGDDNDRHRRSSSSFADHDDAGPLYAACQHYGLPGLRRDCARVMAAALTVDNAATTAALAVAHGDGALLDAAAAFSAHSSERLAAVLASASYGQVSALWPGAAQAFVAAAVERLPGGSGGGGGAE